jgi:hypothetical protein
VNLLHGTVVSYRKNTLEGDYSSSLEIDYILPNPKNNIIFLHTGELGAEFLS